MTDTIHIELDAVRVYRNKQEFRTKPRARSSLGHEITGDAPLVPKLANYTVVMRLHQRKGTYRLVNKPQLSNL